MKHVLNREFLEKEIERVLLALSDQKFIDAIVEFKSKKDEKDRFDFAKNNLNAVILKEKGVQISDDLRISSRSFENDPINQSNVDNEQGYKILNGLLKNKPKLLQKLEESDPKIFDSLKPFLSPNKQQIGNTTVPNSNLADESLIINNLERASLLGGCACGGALSVCAGGGWQQLI